MTKRTPTFLVLACLCVAARGRAAPPPGEPATAPGAASGPARRIIALKHMRIDMDRRRVVLDARVCLRSGGLEFFLCYRGTKEHESILATKAAPSAVHAALLALGLTPGKYARWFPAADGLPERYIPPRGAGLSILLRWKDDKGRVRQADAADWLAVTGRGKRKVNPPKTWIFVGSDLLEDNRYEADINGEIVSVANFAASVIDVPFESSDSNAPHGGENMLSFDANTGAIPPLQTPVEVILAPLPDAEKAEHARAMLQIDRFGRLQMDGRPITLERLRPWAEQFLSRHAKGQVIIRSRARAIAHDVTKVREELRIGGLFDMEEVKLPPLETIAPYILPRTGAQAAKAMARWRHKFADPGYYIREPSIGAHEHLRQIERRLREMEQQKQLLGEYLLNLKAALGRYEATTQPAGRDAAPADPPAE